MSDYQALATQRLFDRLPSASKDGQLRTGEVRVHAFDKRRIYWHIRLPHHNELGTGTALFVLVLNENLCRGERS
jgi:hypothetical protein